jgi:hypothetical protein
MKATMPAVKPLLRDWESVKLVIWQAIMAAISVIQQILKRPGMGPDAPDLFFYACEALDEDGDGNIGAEEYAMLGAAKVEVDKTLLTRPLTRPA